VEKIYININNIECMFTFICNLEHTNKNTEKIKKKEKRKTKKKYDKEILLLKIKRFKTIIMKEEFCKYNKLNIFNKNNINLVYLFKSKIYNINIYLRNIKQKKNDLLFFTNYLFFFCKFIIILNNMNKTHKFFFLQYFLKKKIKNKLIKKKKKKKKKKISSFYYIPQIYYKHKKKCKLLFHIIQNIEKHIIYKKEKTENFVFKTNDNIHFKIKLNIRSCKKYFMNEDKKIQSSIYFFLNERNIISLINFYYNILMLFGYGHILYSKYVCKCNDMGETLNDTCRYNDTCKHLCRHLNEYKYLPKPFPCHINNMSNTNHLIHFQNDNHSIHYDNDFIYEPSDMNNLLIYDIIKKENVILRRMKKKNNNKYFINFMNKIRPDKYQDISYILYINKKKKKLKINKMKKKNKRNKERLKKYPFSYIMNTKKKKNKYVISNNNMLDKIINSFDSLQIKLKNIFFFFYTSNMNMYIGIFIRNIKSLLLNKHIYNKINCHHLKYIQQINKCIIFTRDNYLNHEKIQLSIFEIFNNNNTLNDKKNKCIYYLSPLFFFLNKYHNKKKGLTNKIRKHNTYEYKDNH
ncbi:hypothetical protein PGSY75_0003600D, partial [Plasmodium gaboni]